MSSNDDIDLENPPVYNDENDVNIEIEHEKIDELYTNTMESKLQDIKENFILNAPNEETYNSYIYLESNSPLTISCNNSDSGNEERDFKEITYHEMRDNLDKYFDDTDSKYSNELDILITYMKGQKNLFIQSYLLSQRKLNTLVIPCILMAAAVTIFAPIFKDSEWNIIVISTLNALNAMLISIISYLKLETSTQTFFNTASQYDKLETSLEFTASKLLLINDETMDDVIYEKLQEVEKKIYEIKEWNTLFIPDEIRGIFPIICHINVFSFIKRIENSKKGLILRFKDVKNELRYIIYRADRKHHKERIEKRLQYLTEQKEKIKEELAHYRNAYSYIDEIFTTEIKNARNSSFFLYWIYNSNIESCNNRNPVVDKYIHCLVNYN